MSAGPPTDTLHTGAKIPLLAYGTWGGGDDAHILSKGVIEAIKTGYRHIDCAEIYGNQKEIGDAIAQCIKDGTVKRSDLFITSKVWITNLAPDHVAKSAENTLKDLQMDYVDLLLIHWPIVLKHVGIPVKMSEGMPTDSKGLLQHGTTSLQDAWRAMEKLVDTGKAKHIGVSNYTNILLADLLRYARIPPAVNQVEIHPYLAQEELVHYHHVMKVHVSAYTPLGRAGKIKAQGAAFKPIIEEPLILHIAEELNKEHGFTGDQKIEPAHVLLRWGMQRNISVLPKSSTPSRIRSNYSMTGKFGLSEEQMKQISTLNCGLRYADYDLLTGKMGISMYPAFYEGHILPKEGEKEDEQKKQ